ncbi:MAG: hypothetical protein A3J04_04150 [Candidatus Ryanbacteria bacterium RIFCSPLOWO2_02_FULL_47_14]|uniref:Uncharacterized protein n=1 Tax=Candidatus Ryanbacteria bacterium RIFCSPLOWO2_02_FULL_47_14 TaxID=1802129 RepID=A0A1G2H0D5_9BACT|nr:MAG: hypothetical protein A3J04_04150 [Candidatus Ryanbacteria bacterium RIFCSPLOWO2_02_FULL_47_14]
MNWSNPVIIGLLVFIAFLIVVIVGNTIAASVLGGKFKKRKTTSATTTTKSSGWFWKLVIIGVIGFGIFGVVRYFKTPKKAIVQTVITPKSITERKWKLRWKKLPTTPNGVNGNQREIRLDAVVMKYDRFEFKIVVFYKEQGQDEQALLYWNRVESPHYGIWSQNNPKDSGRWALERVRDDLFVGWETSSTGAEIPLWLEAVD